jgi:hypothetical protein
MYRRTLGIGLWRFQRSIELSDKWDSALLILRILYRGQCGAINTIFSAARLSYKILVDLELLVLVLHAPSSKVMGIKYLCAHLTKMI